MDTAAIATTHEAFAEFMVEQHVGGVREGLAALLKRTDFRYIGIWRFQDGKAAAAVHYDREDPTATTAAEVEETATYCCYVRDKGQPFKTPHALVDERLAAHPARAVVASYCGVPVIDSDGTIVGTLCHYDIVPRDVQQVDIRLMHMVASFVTLSNQLPPYPGGH